MNCSRRRARRSGVGVRQVSGFWFLVLGDRPEDCCGAARSFTGRPRLLAPCPLPLVPCPSPPCLSSHPAAYNRVQRHLGATMSHTRRAFLERSSLAASSLLVPSGPWFRSAGQAATAVRPKLALRFRPYTLQLKHVFTVASNSRTTTPVVLTEVDYDGMVGYGEASMPPYLGESHDTATTV